jgi:3' terminal RNA ribose 2'-O-methyltransferase Hen1
VVEQDDAPDSFEEDIVNLNDARMGSVLAVLKTVNAGSVIDLGCGEGKFLRCLMEEKRFSKLVGMDVSIRALEAASSRLKIHEMPPENVQLIQGSLMYRDQRLAGFDAATIIEVIEHLDEQRLRSLGRVVFEFARPQTVILTTPNREYNVMWENVGTGRLRHRDHRFEWTRVEFQQWALGISQKYGYTARFLSVGAERSDIGSPTQMAVFSRTEVQSC